MIQNSPMILRRPLHCQLKPEPDVGWLLLGAVAIPGNNYYPPNVPARPLARSSYKGDVIIKMPPKEPGYIANRLFAAPLLSLMDRWWMLTKLEGDGAAAVRETAEALALLSQNLSNPQTCPDDTRDELTDICSMLNQATSAWRDYCGSIPAVSFVQDQYLDGKYGHVAHVSYQIDGKSADVTGGVELEFLAIECRPVQ
jgi:hypothetical protein